MAPPIPDRTGAPDAEIVRLVREGETDAFAELVRRTHRPAYRLALRIAQDHLVADGVLRESYVRAYRALHRFDSSHAFGPWLLTIVARTALDRSPRTAAPHAAMPHAAGSLEDTAGVERAFAGMTEEHRAIVALRVEGDLGYAEIADVLGIPVGTVMSRLARARETFVEESRKLEGGRVAAHLDDGAHHPPRAELFAYRDGELPAERRTFTEAHVVGCRTCRALIDDVSGLEAALKSATHEPATDYYETLRGAVLERLAAGIPEGDRKVPAKPAAPPIERRRSEEESRADDSGRIGTPPRLPWAAIVSTVSAAAAVVIVVVLLVRMGAFRRPVSQRRPVVAEQVPPAKEPPVASPSDSVTPAPGPEPKSIPPPEASPKLTGPEKVPGAYGALLRRFGLPPVWAETVPADALERAEPELRYLYQAGRADSDSARVRLYLAEAARLRYVPGQDSILYYKIVRHYRRAIRLQGPDSNVGKIALERLGTLRP